MHDDLQSYPPLQPDEIIAGKYKIIEPIGAGGMSFVVSALHMELNEKVAIKLLRPELMENEEIIGRFTREARSAVRIKSEHVAHIIDVGNLLDGLPYIVMEYLDGQDLYEVLLEQGQLSVDLAIEYLLQTCEALATAHNGGIIHRDIKPENLFLIKRAKDIDIIKVIDFGISKVALTGYAFDKTSMINTTVSIGTPVYMSPEQIRGLNTIDQRTDIWSLGCVLYELITGKAAFDAPSLMQLSAFILEKDPKYDSKIPLDLFTTVVMKCLAKDPNDRFQNVAELAIALYPFGTSRARIMVERCCNILNVNNKFSTIHPKQTIKQYWFLGAIILFMLFVFGLFFSLNHVPKEEIRTGTSVITPTIEIKQLPQEKKPPEEIKEPESVVIIPQQVITQTSPSQTRPRAQKQKTIQQKSPAEPTISKPPVQNNNKEVDVGF